jgi:hypothetical protein
VLTAYLDETGQHEQGIVFVAGFMGKKDAWERCAAAWKAGLGRKQSLHMADLRFKKDRDKTLLERLGPIPEASGLMKVFGSVDAADYSDLIEGTVGEVYASGFCLALVPLVGSILKNLPDDERIQLLFEESESLAFYRERMLSLIARLPQFNGKPNRGQIAGWEAIPKGSTCLFEPADYLCYALSHLPCDPEAVRRKWSQPILGDTPLIGDHLSRDRARRLLSHLNSPDYQKKYPKTTIKAYKAALKAGTIPDPWKDTFDPDW